MKRLSIIALLAGALAGGGCSCRTLTLVSVDGQAYDGIAALKKAVVTVPSKHRRNYQDKGIRLVDNRTAFERALEREDFPSWFCSHWLDILTFTIVPTRTSYIDNYRITYFGQEGVLDTADVQVRSCDHEGAWITAFLPPTLFADEYTFDGLYDNKAYYDRREYLDKVSELVWLLKNGGAR